MALLPSTSKIQEEIIFSEEIKIYRLSEKKILAIPKETLWGKQIEVWQKLF